MNEPVIYKPTWTVWTTGSMAFHDRAHWCWAAHGPRGSQSGVEVSAEDAASKAACAAHVLADGGQR